MLSPAAPQDGLPTGHLAHFINDTVDARDLKAFYARCEGGGSRKIERRLHEDLAFRVLAAGNFPRHRTICDFRASHLKELSELFVPVVKLAREMGLVRLGTVAIDGTKLNAHASRHKAMSYERMKPPNGWIKNVLGFRQFSLRGLHRVRAAWKLACTALNLRRMAVLSAS